MVWKVCFMGWLSVSRRVSLFLFRVGSGVFLVCFFRAGFRARAD